MEYVVVGLSFQTDTQPYFVTTDFMATVIATGMTPNGPVNYTFDDTVPGLHAVD